MLKPILFIPMALAVLLGTSAVVILTLIASPSRFLLNCTMDGIEALYDYWRTL